MRPGMTRCREGTLGGYHYLASPPCPANAPNSRALASRLQKRTAKDHEIVASSTVKGSLLERRSIGVKEEGLQSEHSIAAPNAAGRSCAISPSDWPDGSPELNEPQ